MSGDQRSTEGRGARSPQLAPRSRAAITRRLVALAPDIATATLAEMERRHGWFAGLDASTRSWIGVVARAGIDSFTHWFSEADASATGLEVFGSAPRALARRISLHQTVELVRTTIEVVEAKTQELLPRGDRPIVQAAMLRYSREVAFASAEVYARAAESRGAWDARLEALVVDAVLRGETDEAVLSRASTLGWRTAHGVVVAVGTAPVTENLNLGEDLRRAGQKLGIDLLSAVQGERLVIIAGGEPLEADGGPVRVLEQFSDAFGPGPIVVGPLVDHVVEAAVSARAATSGLRASVAWPEAPRPVASADLLPERALAGDGHARRALGQEVYETLLGAGSGLLETLVTFLDQGQSIEGTARVLFVHANTVRYRLKRIAEVTGYNPSNARDSYVLRIAITLGRLYAAR